MSSLMHVYLEFERILFYHVSFWWNFKPPQMRPKWGWYSLILGFQKCHHWILRVEYSLLQPGASSIAFWSWENLALMSSDLCFWNRDEEGDQQSPHWRKKETIKESRFFHLYFVDSKGCLFFNLVPPFTTFLKEERELTVFMHRLLMLLQQE